MDEHAQGCSRIYFIRVGHLADLGLWNAKRDFGHHVYYCHFYFGIGLYFYGKSQATTKKSLRLICTIILFIITGLLVSWNAIRQPVPANFTSPTEPVVITATGLPWQNYSVQLIEELKSSGKPFFLRLYRHFGVLSCQVNDRLALSDRRVVKAFLDQKITPVKADWTNNDPSVTSALASYRPATAFLCMFFLQPATYSRCFYRKLLLQTRF